MKDSIFAKHERVQFNRMSAKGILEKLMNIRQNINVKQTARRLIWELMQNAKDNVQLSNEEDVKVNITISLTDDKFIFSHDKGYFTNDQTTGLVRKYSSEDKNRDNETPTRKTTGRFGTGFMTTHLLSEIIQVKSCYKNEIGNFHDFGFTIDRSGRTESEIIKGIELAFSEAEESINNNLGSYKDSNSLCTTFTYPLDNQKYSLAQRAVSEVMNCIAHTLINVPEIASVKIHEELQGDFIYKIDIAENTGFKDDNITLYRLLENGNVTNNYFLYLSESDLQIVVPVTRDGLIYNITALNSSIPRLCLDFPMTGTEQLNIPFIINSYLFEPTEPRDGVTLMGDDNEISIVNCNLMIRAVKLYSKLIDIISKRSDFGSLFNLARISDPAEQKWIDQNWFVENVTHPIQSKLLNSDIVDVCTNKRVSILDFSDYYQVVFPSSIDDETRNGIWELSTQIYIDKTPVKDNIKVWDEIMWDNEPKLSISELSTFIEEQGNLETLAQTLNGSKSDALRFLNQYYKLIVKDNSIIDQITLGYYKVIPNQNGCFEKVSDLCVDEDINDELKIACSIINTDPREYLLHKDIYTGEGIEYKIKKRADIISTINYSIETCSEENRLTCCNYLMSLIPTTGAINHRQILFDLSKRILPHYFNEKNSLNYYSEDIWRESDKHSVYYIVSAIANCKDVISAVERFEFNDSLDFIEWLDYLISFLVKNNFKNNIDRKRDPILPNQNGVFLTKEELFLDDGDIGGELKDIAFELGSDFRSKLLDTAIYLDLPENRTYGISDVANTISAQLKLIVRDTDKRIEHKSVLKKFYLWMNNNTDLAKMHFQDLYETKFLFLDDDDIATNIRKATEFDQLLSDCGISSIEELRNKLLTMKHEDRELSKKITLTSEVLAGLGVLSQEDLDQIMQNPDISQFYHSSTPSIDMFEYAQKLINRAKTNVINHLTHLDGYDCSEMDETAATVLAGILKKGISINVVVRPSDSGEVIIYYESEKDTLDVEDSELWVDNGINTPHLLTLGRILKSTGINKIPIKMD